MPYADKEKARAYCKAYREANREKEQARKKVWREANREKERARHKAYCEVNREKVQAWQQAWREANREKARARQQAWRGANREKLQTWQKVWREANREKARACCKAWRKANPERARAQTKAWRDANREKVRTWRARRRQEDVQFRLATVLRARLHNALCGNFKSGSAVRDLGCSIAELKAHLESQFEPGMTWDNWAVDGWHIDHIIPLAAFDLTDREQFKQACHYTNLRPLWAAANISKGARVFGGEVTGNSCTCDETATEWGVVWTEDRVGAAPE
jgi:hypothetical protein